MSKPNKNREENQTLVSDETLTWTNTRDRQILDLLKKATQKNLVIQSWTENSRPGLLLTAGEFNQKAFLPFDANKNEFEDFKWVIDQAIQSEEASKTKKLMVQQALAKLTPEEKFALGLK